LGVTSFGPRLAGLEVLSRQGASFPILPCITQRIKTGDVVGKSEFREARRGTLLSWWPGCDACAELRLQADRFVIDHTISLSF